MGVLCYHIDDGGKAKTWVNMFMKTCKQIQQSLGWVSRKYWELKEHEAALVTQVLGTSGIIQGLPYYDLTNSQHRYLEVIDQAGTGVGANMQKYTRT